MGKCRKLKIVLGLIRASSPAVRPSFGNQHALSYTCLDKHYWWDGRRQSSKIIRLSVRKLNFLLNQFLVWEFGRSRAMETRTQCLWSLLLKRVLASGNSSSGRFLSSLCLLIGQNMDMSTNQVNETKRENSSANCYNLNSNKQFFLK